jgi:hypothetical protein
MQNDKHQKKKFIFPENISSSYGVFLGLSLKELLLYVVPPLLIGIVVLVLPPNNITVTIIKLIVLVLIITVILAVLSSTPVKSRSNIRLPQYLKMKNSYDKRQHLFFKAKKKER